MRPQAFVEEHFIGNLFGKGESNTKIAKDTEKAVCLYLSLYPHKVPNRPELGNICEWASKGCAAVCLNTSGYAGVFPDVVRGRIARRVLYQTDFPRFERMWHYEMEKALKKAEYMGRPLVVRPNTYSDIDWHGKHPDLIERYPTARFHDYTKDQNKYERFLRGEHPPNYHLTFSRSEDNQEKCLEYLGRGGNIAVTSHIPQPPMWYGYRTINGDESDLRMDDPKNVVVWLKAKGKARKNPERITFLWKKDSESSMSDPVKNPVMELLEPIACS